MNDYHNRIMNIKAVPRNDVALKPDGQPSIVYKMGHRDARHEAADIALEAENLIEELYEALNQAVTSMQDSGYPNRHAAVLAAKAALAKARGEF